MSRSSPSSLHHQRQGGSLSRQFRFFVETWRHLVPQPSWLSWCISWWLTRWLTWLMIAAVEYGDLVDWHGWYRWIGVVDGWEWPITVHGWYWFLQNDESAITKRRIWGGNHPWVTLFSPDPRVSVDKPVWIGGGDVPELLTVFDLDLFRSLHVGSQAARSMSAGLLNQLIVLQIPRVHHHSPPSSIGLTIN